MFTSSIGVGFTDGDEDVETLMVDTDISFSRQLNITNSNLQHIIWCIGEVKEDSCTYIRSALFKVSIADLPTCHHLAQ